MTVTRGISSCIYLHEKNVELKLSREAFANSTGHTCRLSPQYSVARSVKLSTIQLSLKSVCHIIKAKCEIGLYY